MDTEQTKLKIRQFLSKYLRNHEVRDDEDIFATGYVNSLFAMQLVMFVENQFGVAVEDEDLDIENFRSVEAIAALVGRKAVAAEEV